MEVTKFWTKTKIIILLSILLVIGIVVAVIFINRARLKNEYIKLEKSITTSVVQNHLVLEDIKLEENQYKKIDIKALYNSGAMSGKYNDACIGYVIAEQDKVLKSKTYIKCGSIYTTEGYGSTSTKTENKDVGQSENDTTKPVITLLGEENMTVGLDEKFKDPGASASDNVDGDITKKIKTSGKVDTSKEGTYTITYSVSDKAGNKATKKRNVTVKKGQSSSGKDTIKPVITFKNASTHQTVCIGETIDTSKDGVYGYSAHDDVDGDITNNVKISGVNTSAAGTFTIKYTVTDKAGNVGEASREYTVKDCSTPTPDPTPDPTPTPTPDPTPTPTPDPTPTPQPDPTPVPTTVEVTGINVRSSVTLTVGSVVNLGASVSPSNATNQTIYYSSTNDSVVSVISGNGDIQGRGKGTAVITLSTPNGKYATVTVTVQ